ncbi:MAG: pyridoxamine 5'-phosphate oxidase family protein [Dehalogenimonas sp.]
MDQKSVITTLLTSSNLAVLATIIDGAPYCHLMIIAFSNDQQNAFFVTRRDSGKFRQIKQYPKVSILIDNRCIYGIENASALTITGTASEVIALEREKALVIFIHRYPELKEFACRSDHAVFRVDINRLELNHFNQK